MVSKLKFSSHPPWLVAAHCWLASWEKTHMQESSTKGASLLFRCLKLTTEQWRFLQEWCSGWVHFSFSFLQKDRLLTFKNFFGRNSKNLNFGGLLGANNLLPTVIYWVWNQCRSTALMAKKIKKGKIPLSHILLNQIDTSVQNYAANISFLSCYFIRNRRAKRILVGIINPFLF